MKQYSTDNSPLGLTLLSGDLLFADPLFFQMIADHYAELEVPDFISKKELVRIFEDRLFPEGEGLILGYKKAGKTSEVYEFAPSMLKKWETGNEARNTRAAEKEITVLGLETASFLIMDIENISRLVSLINYDDLINASLENKLDTYSGMLNGQLGNKGWAYAEIRSSYSLSDLEGESLSFYSVE